MSTKQIPLVEVEYLESGAFQGGEEDVFNAEIDTGEDCVVASAKHRRLIAAAPDLLAALKRLLELCEAGEGADRYGQQQAREAIAKAEGAE